VIDTATNKPAVKAIAVGRFPEQIAITPDGSRAYVADTGSNAVSVIDTATNSPAAEGIRVGRREPIAIAVGPDGSRVYVTNARDDTVSVIDLTSHKPAAKAIPTAAASTSSKTREARLGSNSLLSMKASIRAVAIGVVGGILLSCAATGAMAAPGHFAMPASRSMELHVKGSHGFGITLFGNSGQVYLTIRGHHASNVYLLRGRVGEKEIKARFGRLGRVSMRFRPGHKAQVVPGSDGGCKGGDQIIERGSFTGTLNFTGEQGYTTVSAARATGKVVSTGRLVCKASGEGEGPSEAHWMQLEAASKNGNVSFSASKIASKAHSKLDSAFFYASIVEFHFKGMSVIRTLDAQADPAVFKAEKFHGHIATASVEPPAPFHGAAVYRRAEGATSWTGNLTGVFPGRGEVRLAGPEFCAGSPFPPAKCASGAIQVAFSG
jgi:YVTN family beta-propeller protein